MECREQEVPDAEGNDLQIQENATQLQCQVQCRLTPACDAVAWSRTQSTCYMKQGFDPGVAVWGSSEDFDFCWVPSQGCPHAYAVLASSVYDMLHNHQPSLCLPASTANCWGCHQPTDTASPMLQGQDWGWGVCGRTRKNVTGFLGCAHTPELFLPHKKPI